MLALGADRRNAEQVEQLADKPFFIGFYITFYFIHPARVLFGFLQYVIFVQRPRDGLFVGIELAQPGSPPPCSTPASAPSIGGQCQQVPLHLVGALRRRIPQSWSRYFMCRLYVPSFFSVRRMSIPGQSAAGKTSRRMFPGSRAMLSAIMHVGPSRPSVFVTFSDTAFFWLVAPAGRQAGIGSREDHDFILHSRFV